MYKGYQSINLGNRCQYIICTLQTYNINGEKYIYNKIFKLQNVKKLIWIKKIYLYNLSNVGNEISYLILDGARSEPGKHCGITVILIPVSILTDDPVDFACVISTFTIWT